MFVCVTLAGIPPSPCRHGMYRTDHLIYNDPELSFLESIPQSALFTPNPSIDDNPTGIDPTSNEGDTEEHGSTSPRPLHPPEEGSDSEEGEREGEVELGGVKTKSSAPNSTPVPLGWPKVIKQSIIIITMSTNYCY